MQHDEGSRNLKAAATAVSREADHEDSPPANVSHETVTELATAMKFSWHARTEATVRGLVISISQEALVPGAMVGACLFRSGHCLSRRSNLKWAEGIFSTHLLGPWPMTECAARLGGERCWRDGSAATEKTAEAPVP